MIKTDNEAAVLKRMDGNRRRQIRKSLEAGAVITEAKLEEEVKDFYIILEQLYKEKVKKPLPSYELFLKFWQSRIGKFFIVKFDGVVVGGSMCPTFENKIIYDWFRCGKIDVAPGVHAGILAAWASIDYALKHGFEYMDFMGAGRPDEEYGVRTFKEPFGGEKVTFGRYHTIINRPLYQAGKLGLAIYQKIKQ
ncbi:MAG: GNAT family N-acetyltransferase [Saprospiraceae bacterium]|nr:GNAT family N-acetyltransferase [Saprospiraceae bacterium]